MQRGGVHCGEFVVRRLKIWRRRGENVTRLPATTPAEPPIRQTQGVVGMHCTDEETRVYLLETRDTGPHEAMGNESSPSPLEKSYTVLREGGATGYYSSTWNGNDAPALWSETNFAVLPRRPSASNIDEPAPGSFGGGTGAAGRRVLPDFLPRVAPSSPPPTLYAISTFRSAFTRRTDRCN